MRGLPPLISSGASRFDTWSGASDAELRDLIDSIGSRWTDRYSEERAALTESGDPSTRKAKIEMYQIGG
jgi:hypothetical protein